MTRAAPAGPEDPRRTSRQIFHQLHLLVALSSDADCHDVNYATTDFATSLRTASSPGLLLQQRRRVATCRDTLVVATSHRRPSMRPIAVRRARFGPSRVLRGATVESDDDAGSARVAEYGQQHGRACRLRRHCCYFCCCTPPRARSAGVGTVHARGLLCGSTQCWRILPPRSL